MAPITPPKYCTQVEFRLDSKRVYKLVSRSWMRPRLDHEKQVPCQPQTPNICKVNHVFWRLIRLFPVNAMLDIDCVENERSIDPAIIVYLCSWLSRLSCPLCLTLFHQINDLFPSFLCFPNFSLASFYPLFSACKPFFPGLIFYFRLGVEDHTCVHRESFLSTYPRCGDRTVNSACGEFFSR